MRALVTGANGFVGSTLCRKLVERGDTVRGLVRQTSDLSLIAGLPVERCVGSLDDWESLNAAAREVDVVYHLAGAVSDWGTLAHFRRINVEGTRCVLEAAVANKVGRFIYISSTAVHGFPNAQDMDETWPQPETPFPYSRSKQEAEALALSYHSRGETQVVVVRPGDIYGPGDRVVLQRLSGLLDVGAVPLIANGARLGALTYVENLGDGLILAGTVEHAAGEAYIVTDGVKVTWREYAEKLSGALGVPSPRLSIGSTVAGALAAMLESAYRLLGVRARPPLTRYLVKHLSTDYHFRIDKARRELGYVPRVGLDEALERTAAWYRGWRLATGG
jgi:nucleoside-diphosphate-sugar epimerase